MKPILEMKSNGYKFDGKMWYLPWKREREEREREEGEREEHGQLK